MKKLVALLLTLSLLCTAFTGCHFSQDNLTSIEPSSIIQPDISSESPSEKTSQSSSENPEEINIFKQRHGTVTKGKRIAIPCDEKYYVRSNAGTKVLYYTYENQQMQTSDLRCYLYDWETGENFEIGLIKNWHVDSGNTVVMQDRYIYFVLGTLGEIDLLTYIYKVDTKENTLERIETEGFESPLVFMRKIDDDNFLIYYRTISDMVRVYYRVFNITEDKFVNEIVEERSIEDNKIGMGAAAVRNGEIFIITDYINDTDGNQEYFVNIYDKQLEFKKKVPIDALGNFILHGGYGEMGIWEYFIYGDYLIFDMMCERMGVKPLILLKYNGESFEVTYSDFENKYGIYENHNKFDESLFPYFYLKQSEGTLITLFSTQTEEIKNFDIKIMDSGYEFRNDMAETPIINENGDLIVHLRNQSKIMSDDPDSKYYFYIKSEDIFDAIK